MSEAMIGSQIAHYRLTAKLGAGGMGEVYLASDTKLGREVALKVLPGAMTSDAAARARLVREARTASALNHPNICHIYEVGEFDGLSYIAMERVEGRPLSESIPADGLPVETVLRYATQLADALAHAHERSVLHRDLKSVNVMITLEGRAKVLDFGLAKLSASGAEEASGTVDSLTQAGSVAGTLHYLAPELLSGRPADAQSDIWALGVVIYEMSTGIQPFVGKTSFEVSAAILREAPQPLPAQVPAGLRSIIMHCLAKEPSQRYRRAGELRAALEAISSDTAAAPVASSLDQSSQAAIPSQKMQKPHRLRWLYWGVAPLLVVLGYIVWDNFFSEHARQPLAQRQKAAAQTSRVEEGTRRSIGGKPSPNADANVYVEKAMLFLRGQFDLPRGRQMLEKALELDPKFAEARAAYALTHLLEVENGLSNETAWIYRAEQDAQQALRDNPESPQGQVTLGAVYVMQGKKELFPPRVKRVLESDPRNVGALMWLAQYYRLNGDYSAALAQTQKISEVSPLFWANRVVIGTILHQTGDRAGAVHEFTGVLDQDAQNPYVLRELARGHIEAGDTRTAQTFLERIRPMDRQNFRVRLAWALLYAKNGKRREALKEMDGEVQKYAEVNPNLTMEAAEFYSILGDKTKALDWLEKAVHNGDERTAWFGRDPLLEGIRGEFRFRSLVESIANRRQQKSSDESRPKRL